MKKKKLPLAKVWKLRCKLLDAGYKLRAEGNKLRDERAKGFKLWADKLIADGYKLRSEGDRLWLDAVKDANLDYDWTVWNNGCECKLSNGDVYRHDQKGG